MKLEVHDPIGTLLGRIELQNLRLLEVGRPVRFARAASPRYYGRGLRELDESAIDRSFATIDFTVGEWATRPAIGKEGGYWPGRVDFVLRYDGPVDALYDVPAFERAPR